MKSFFLHCVLLLAFLAAAIAQPATIQPIKPLVITDTVFEDSDDPAIWINYKNPANSLVLGTDKDNENGGIYVFNLQGKIDRQKTKTGMKRVNNIDVAYGLSGSGKQFDIAVATERGRNMLRVLQVPEMNFADNGGISVFANEKDRAPMGIALYTRPKDHAIFAIVSRKTGPADNYLEQYELQINSQGIVKGKLVRKFGKFSGVKEIESVAVDNELGFVYYSDEQYGIRKYYADPAKGNEELAVFGSGEFKEDNEGISIYKTGEKTGYILVSDQSANRFNVYPREGEPGQPNLHNKICSIPVMTDQSDGSDVVSVALPGFKGGMFVAMSTNKTFQFYSWDSFVQSFPLKEIATSKR